MSILTRLTRPRTANPDPRDAVLAHLRAATAVLRDLAAIDEPDTLLAALRALPDAKRRTALAALLTEATPAQAANLRALIPGGAA